MEETKIDRTSYFAVQDSEEELVAAVAKRVAYNALRLAGSTFVRNWLLNHKFYHNEFFGIRTNETVTIDPEQQIKGTSLNHYRNIIRHMLNFVTQDRINLDVIAKQNSPNALSASKIGEKAMEHYLTQKSLEEKIYDCDEMALVYCNSFLMATWDKTQGSPLVAASDGRVIKTGDMVFNEFSPFEVFYDFVYGCYDPNWICVRKKVNKYDCAVENPEKADEIMAMSLDQTDQLDHMVANIYNLVPMEDDPKDEIYKYFFFHKRTPSLPRGLQLTFTMNANGNSAVLLGKPSDLMYDKIPIFRLFPAKQLRMPFGFSEANILRQPQEVINTAISSFYTNMDATGIINFWTPTGAGMTVKQIEGGLRHIESTVKPEALNLCNMPKELMEGVKECISNMQLLSGVNATVRGEPQPNVKAGISMALVTALASMFSNSFERNHALFVEEIGNHIISTLRTASRTMEENGFKDAIQITTVAGDCNYAEAVSFVSDQMDLIHGIRCRMGNPILRTPSGKVAVADNLLQYNMLSNPRQYMTVLKTGNLDSITDPYEKEDRWILQENELLLQGKTIQAMMGEDDQIHIQQHRTLLFDNTLRTDEKMAPILSAILNHIQQHIVNMKNGNLPFLMSKGMMPPAPTPQMQEVENPGMQKTLQEQTIDTQVMDEAQGIKQAANEAKQNLTGGQ